MIFTAGISIALFISALLIVKKNKTTSDLFLLLWMILNAIHLTFHYLSNTGAIYDYPALLGIQFPLPLLHGVLLYYYVASVTDQLPKRKILVFAHLIPVLVTLLYLTRFFTLPGTEKINIFKNGGQEYAVFQMVLLASIFISGITYVIWSSLLLRKHRKRINNQFSNTEEINLRWLQFLTYGLGVVWTLVIVTQNDPMIFTAVSIFVILVGFFGIQQKNIFNNDPIAEEVTTQKYVSSGLSDEKADTFYKKLDVAMRKEKIFTDTELSLKDLAARLDIHPNYLSQIINERENKTFYDYVNFFRVEEFKRLSALPESDQYTLITLAYACGFNSKSSFNRYFKKITDQTPSQYLKASKN